MSSRNKTPKSTKPKKSSKLASKGAPNTKGQGSLGVKSRNAGSKNLKLDRKSSLHRQLRERFMVSSDIVLKLGQKILDKVKSIRTSVTPGSSNIK